MIPDLDPELEAQIRQVVDQPKPPKFNARQLALELHGETPVARGGGELFT